MESLFLDTSFILALEDADDQNHEQAIAFWKGFTNRPRKLVTTTYIFDETVTFLKRRMGLKKAAEVGKRLLESPSVEMIHVSPEDFESGWKLFLKYRDKGFSFTDCVSFVVMDQRNIKAAISFDVHFNQMGFKIL